MNRVFLNVDSIAYTAPMLIISGEEYVLLGSLGSSEVRLSNLGVYKDISEDIEEGRLVEVL